MLTFAISSSLSTAQDVENIAALPVEAAQAEEMLRDGANLLQVRAGWVHRGWGGCELCCAAAEANLSSNPSCCCSMPVCSSA